MASKTKVKWKNDLTFEAELDGHKFHIDAPLNESKDDKGPRPKGLLLVALAGCTGMDVVSILKKMKVEGFSFEMEVTGEIEQEFPKPYHTINLIYKFEGKDLPKDKIKRAVELSETRYCGVSDMLKKAAKLNYAIYINNEAI